MNFRGAISEHFMLHFLHFTNIISMDTRSLTFDYKFTPIPDSDSCNIERINIRPSP